MIKKIITNNIKVIDKELLQYSLQLRALNFLNEKKELNNEIYEKSKKHIERVHLKSQTMG